MMYILLMDKWVLILLYVLVILLLLGNVCSALFTVSIIVTVQKVNHYFELVLEGELIWL